MGKKIYHLLKSYDELDSMMKHYLNPAAYINMCEILDNIRTKVNLVQLNKIKCLIIDFE